MIVVLLPAVYFLSYGPVQVLRIQSGFILHTSSTPVQGHIDDAIMWFYGPAEWLRRESPIVKAVYAWERRIIWSLLDEKES